MIAISAFFCAAGFLVYVLIGYPLLLRWLARRSARPIKRQPYEPNVSLVICVYNGQEFIESKLRSVMELDYPHDKLEVLVASDGSSDQTVELARRFGAPVRVLDLPHTGKAGALNAAIAQAHGEILVLTDVRQRLDQPSLRFLMENFADPTVGACSAELVILSGETQEEANVGLYWRYEFLIRTWLSQLDSIFGATGAYYAIRRSLVRPLPQHTLLDDMHLPLEAFFQGYRLIVDPRARMFDSPTRLGSEFRRKVRTLAGNQQILKHFPQLIGPANRLWLHYISYKFARLLLPYALLLLFISSFWLPRPWNWGLILAQGLFYAIAALDPLIPERGLLKRISSPARTFTTLMAAALCSISFWFVPSSRLWKPSGIQTHQPVAGTDQSQ